MGRRAITYLRPPHRVLQPGDLAPLFRKLKRRLHESCDSYRTIARVRREQPSALPRPGPLEPGTLEYYDLRHDRYASTHHAFRRAFEPLGLTPAADPPDYFHSYGQPNLNNFARLRMGRANSVDKLTPAGIMWRNNTLRALQEAIELLIEREPALALASMYFDQDVFRSYAFKSHLIAYERSGLYGLPTGDMLTILTTGNDHHDLFTAAGLDQAAQAALASLARRDGIRCLLDSVVFRAKSLAARDVRLIERNTLRLLRRPDNGDATPAALRVYFDSSYGVAADADASADGGAESEALDTTLERVRQLIRSQARRYGRSSLGPLVLVRDALQLTYGLILIVFRMPANLWQTLKLLLSLPFRLARGLWDHHRHGR